MSDSKRRTALVRIVAISDFGRAGSPEPVMMSYRSCLVGKWRLIGEGCGFPATTPLMGIYLSLPGGQLPPEVSTGTWETGTRRGHSNR